MQPFSTIILYRTSGEESYTPAQYLLTDQTGLSTHTFSEAASYDLILAALDFVCIIWLDLSWLLFRTLKWIICQDYNVQNTHSHFNTQSRRSIMYKSNVFAPNGKKHQAGLRVWSLMPLSHLIVIPNWSCLWPEVAVNINICLAFTCVVYTSSLPCLNDISVDFWSERA